MTTIKKGDFVEVEYTGTVKGENIIFDTTDEKTAKENGIHNPNNEYGPVVVCLGEGQLLEGLEEWLEGKDIGTEYNVDLAPEKAFGKKDAARVKMIPFSAFKKQNIEPQPGLQINVDGMTGLVRRAGGGRCLVDFNHPLAGREVIYKIKADKIVTDDKTKVQSFLKLGFGLKADVEVKEDVVHIKAKAEIPEEIRKLISDKITSVIPSVKKLEFAAEKSRKEAANNGKKPDNTN